VNLPGDPAAWRHTYGHLVASLVRRMGADHLADIEDAVQSALLVALERWRDAPPDDPVAWLYRVAHRKVLEGLRTRARRGRILERRPGPEPAAPENPPLAEELGDDLLRMLFVGCDPDLPPATQVVLVCKTLCGFSTAEVAARLHLSTANVHKRLQRARARLREAPLHLDHVVGARDRLPAVQQVLYLLFTEGYLSLHASEAIRQELCDEALRLTRLLGAHKVGRGPETEALLALMCLHRARLAGRTDGFGGLLLLEEQDRSRWDPALLGEGMVHLAASASGERFGRYHAEARIAAAHGLSPSFDATPWQDIADTYALLERLAPSPLHTLNRALAVAELNGAEAGLAVLEGLAPPSWLSGSYAWCAVRADLHRRAHHPEEADRLRALALDLAPTDAVRTLLARRLSPVSAPLG